MFLVFSVQLLEIGLTATDGFGLAIVVMCGVNIRARAQLLEVLTIWGGIKWNWVMMTTIRHLFVTQKQRDNHTRNKDHETTEEQQHVSIIHFHSALRISLMEKSCNCTFNQFGDWSRYSFWDLNKTYAVKKGCEVGDHRPTTYYYMLLVHVHIQLSNGVKLLLIFILCFSICPFLDQ